MPQKKAENLSKKLFMFRLLIWLMTSLDKELLVKARFLKCLHLGLQAWKIRHLPQVHLVLNVNNQFNMEYPACVSSSRVTSMENPSPAASPFGSQCKQPIQYGMSSLRVKDKPALVKYSMLTTRHLSGRIKLPVRKYDPKSNALKIPYFCDTKEILIAAYVPRENPRALVVCPENLQQTAMMENIDEEKMSGSTYENERDDIENVAQFNNREVIVYMDDHKKSPVGEGLNKAAEITLLNIKCFDKNTRMQHMDGSKVVSADLEISQLPIGLE